MSSNCSTLTPEQRKEAEHHENIVDDALAGYVEVGIALREIQQKCLHKGRFIDYATDRFGMKSHTVYRLMRAAEVAKRLMDAGLPRPRNVGQAHRLHELVSDDPDEQIAIWKQLVESEVPQTTSAIDRFFEDQKPCVEEEEQGAAGEIDVSSAHHVTPVTFPASDAEPLPCLQRAAQDLRAVSNALADGYDQLDLLESEIEQIADLVKSIQEQLSLKTVAA